MKHANMPLKASYHPAVGPLGDIGCVFRKLGGISRLDVVFSLISLAGVALWRCISTNKKKAVRASLRSTVCLLTYVPSDSQQEAG